MSSIAIINTPSDSLADIPNELHWNHKHPARIHLLVRDQIALEDAS